MSLTTNAVTPHCPLAVLTIDHFELELIDQEFNNAFSMSSINGDLLIQRFSFIELRTLTQAKIA